MISDIEGIRNTDTYSFEDKKAVPGIKYEYSVIGVNKRGEELGKLSGLGEVFAIPTHVDDIKTSFVGANTVKIKWTYEKTVSGYYIYRSFDKKKWDKIDILNSGKKHSYVDEVGIGDKHCHYKVVPFIVSGKKKIRGSKKIKCSTVRSVKGIDVSYHNGRIDWKKVKESGIDFAFIRVGYGDSYKSSGGVLDSEFYRNVRNARKNGIDIGVYVYSTAINVNQAKKEAQFVIDAIKDLGDFEYPIVYDFESEYRKKYIHKAENTRMVKAFFKEIEKAGYENVTIYSDFNMLYRYLKYSEIEEKYGCWMAYWTYDYDRFPTDKFENVKYWQFSDRGRIPGITEDVDLNVRYVTGS